MDDVLQWKEEWLRREERGDGGGLARIESYCSRGPKGDSQCLKNIRNSIKYVKALEARKIAFKECVLQVSGIGTKVGLRMDVAT